jgi:hypothetical protein
MADPTAVLSNPAGWPADVLQILQRAVTCEFATVTGHGMPITFPVTPHLGEDRRTLDVATGLAYPGKAERARRNPKVGLLFADAIGSGLSAPPIVLVSGLATVRDHDLQSGTDRYLRLSRAKLPGLYSQLPWWILRRQTWYWCHLWIMVTPVRILWWPGGNIDRSPLRWDAPAGTAPEPSDPGPSGPALPPWQPARADWRHRAAHAAHRLGTPDLTVMDREGYPVLFSAQGATLVPEGFRLELPASTPALAAGPACLTFHAHDSLFTREENAAFVGQVEVAGGGGKALFHVARALGDLSAPGAWPRRVWSVLALRRRLHSRLYVEAARRGQPVPRILRQVDAPLARRE